MATLTVSAAEEKRVKGLGFLSNKGTDNFSARVITVNGKLSAEQFRLLADAAEQYGNGTLTLTSRMTVEVQGIPFEKIDGFVAALKEGGMSVGGTGPKVRPIVSCKGTTCQFGLIDTFALSEKIHYEFYEKYHGVVLPHKFKIAVGGCPNNCVKPDLNDLGIIGQRISNFDAEVCKGCKKCAIETSCPMKASKVENGKLVIDKAICNNCGRCVGKCPFGAIPDGKTGYAVYVGGCWGKKGAPGKKLPFILKSEQEALQMVEKAILLFKDQGIAGERFAKTIERIGLDTACEMLKGDDLLARKAEILAK